VAEANMVSTAIGMSKAGFIPVVDTFAAFGVTKGNLPLIMASLSQAPVIAVFSHTGFQDAADGASHQSLTYMSALASIPHLNIVNLSSAKEAEMYVYQAVNKIASDRQVGRDGESYVFFLGRENFALEVQEDLTYELHAPQRLTTGKDLAIIATGSLTEKALKAQEKLLESGIEATVINHNFINNTDFGQIAQWISESGHRIVTVEDHQLTGGMGALLVHKLKLSGLEFHVESLGVHGEFGQSAYSADELYAKHQLDENAITHSAQRLVKHSSSPLKGLEAFVKEFSSSVVEKDFEKAIHLVQDKLGVSKEEATKKVEELLKNAHTEQLKEKAQKTAGVVLSTATSIFELVKDRIKK